MTNNEKKDLHTETIINHITIVKDLCYQMGIPELGNAHDLSKFSPDEFEIYNKDNFVITLIKPINEYIKTENDIEYLIIDIKKKGTQETGYSR